MAEGDGTLYRRFKSLLMEGDIDLSSGGDALKVTLHTAYSPSQAHEDWADVSASEYGGGSGYTAGGKTLGSQAVVTETTVHRGEFDAADVTWTALVTADSSNTERCDSLGRHPKRTCYRSPDWLFGNWEPRQQMGEITPSNGVHLPSAIILLT